MLRFSSKRIISLPKDSIDMKSSKKRCYINLCKDEVATTSQEGTPYNPIALCEEHLKNYGIKNKKVAIKPIKLIRNQYIGKNNRNICQNNQLTNQNKRHIAENYTEVKCIEELKSSI